MDFFKKLFGNNTNQQQDNFIVDENGVAKDVPATHATITTLPQSNIQSNPQSPTQNNQNANPVQNLASTASAPEEFVGDTSAFDELMKQAENSVDMHVPEEPVDPEFQKVKDEIAKEEGIEIFPAN